MLEEVLIKELNDREILYVKNTGESIRGLADADLKKHGFNPVDSAEKAKAFLLKTEKSLTHEEMDRIYEIMTGNINFPLYRITTSDINGLMIKYERRNETEEEIILSRLIEDEYNEVVSVQTHGNVASVSTIYDDDFYPQVWDEFPPHEKYDPEKLVGKIFEIIDDEVLKQYRPMLNDGKSADVKLDEILDGIGTAFYMWRNVPKCKKYIPDALLRASMDENMLWTYDRSNEMKTIMLFVLGYVMKNREKVADYVEDKRKSLPDEDGKPLMGLYLGLIRHLGKKIFFKKIAD